MVVVEDIDVRNDDGVDVQNTSRRNTTKSAGLVSPYSVRFSMANLNQFVEWLRHGQTINF